GIRKKMHALAEATARKFNGNLEGKDSHDKIKEITQLMNSLSYEAEITKPADEKSPPVIEAWNCVYHRLAKEFPEVCEFDIALLESLSGQAVDHQECIIRGGNACRFAFNRKKT